MSKNNINPQQVDYNQDQNISINNISETQTQKQNQQQGQELNIILEKKNNHIKNQFKSQNEIHTPVSQKSNKKHKNTYSQKFLQSLKSLSNKNSQFQDKNQMQNSDTSSQFEVDSVKESHRPKNVSIEYMLSLNQCQSRNSILGSFKSRNSNSSSIEPTSILQIQGSQNIIGTQQSLGLFQSPSNSQKNLKFQSHQIFVEDKFQNKGLHLDLKSSTQKNQEINQNKFNFSLNQIIDTTNTLEIQIHKWLDEKQIFITDPEEKQNQYYQQKKERVNQMIRSTKSIGSPKRSPLQERMLMKKLKTQNNINLTVNTCKSDNQFKSITQKQIQFASDSHPYDEDTPENSKNRFSFKAKDLQQRLTMKNSVFMYTEEQVEDTKKQQQQLQKNEKLKTQNSLNSNKNSKNTISSTSSISQKSSQPNNSQNGSSQRMSQRQIFLQQENNSSNSNQQIKSNNNNIDKENNKLKIKKSKSQEKQQLEENKQKNSLVIEDQQTNKLFQIQNYYLAENQIEETDKKYEGDEMGNSICNTLNNIDQLRSRNISYNNSSNKNITENFLTGSLIFGNQNSTGLIQHNESSELIQLKYKGTQYSINEVKNDQENDNYKDYIRQKKTSINFEIDQINYNTINNCINGKQLNQKDYIENLSISVISSNKDCQQSKNDATPKSMSILFNSNENLPHQSTQNIKNNNINNNIFQYKSQKIIEKPSYFQICQKNQILSVNSQKLIQINQDQNNQIQIFSNNSLNVIEENIFQ